MHEQLLAKSLLTSEQVLQVEATEQVAHLAGHLLQVPLFSKNPSEHEQVLSKMLKLAPGIQT